MDSNRRRFLSRAALGARFLAAAEAASAPSRIIDTHIHLYDPGRPQGVPWPPKSNALLYRRTLPADFQAATSGLGVTGVVVVESNAWIEDNQWILDLAKESPIIKGFVGHVEPGDSFARNLERFAKNPLFRGIRLSGRAITAGLHHPEFFSDLQRLADRDLEMDAIGDSAMFSDLVTVTDRVPRLRIVINHLPYDSMKPETAFRELGRRPQVYAKVSGVLRHVGDRVPLEMSYYRESLDKLWETFGRDRVIYGSNWPVSNQWAPYAGVLKVVREYFTAKGAEAAEHYFWKNSLAAYKWLDRA